MNRREFLQAAAVLTAGGSILPAGWAMNRQQRSFLASQPNYIDRHALSFFSLQQRATVTAIAEQIIPQTETPGATTAGVPRFIELMVSDWFDDKEREFFMAGLADLEQRAEQDFAGLTAAQQLQILQELEQLASSAPWFATGNFMRIWDDQAPFICQFKELTVLGFFLSEVGATQVLRDNPMGTFHGDIPLAVDDPAYAAQLPMRMMAGEQNL